MRRRVVTLTVVMAVALMVGIATVAYAQPPVVVNNFTLEDNGWDYTERNLRQNRINESGGLNSDFQFENNFDQLQQNWWWYRAGSDTREYALSNLTFFNQFAPNGATLQYTEPIDDGDVEDALQFELTYVLTGISDTTATVAIDWSVTNLTDERTIPLNFFSYTDPDLENNPNDDTAQRLAFSSNNGLIRVFDANGVTFMDIAAGTSNLVGWEIDEFNDLRQKLTDNDIDNLSNTTTPFGPDNVTTAYQWAFTIDPGSTVSGTLSKTVAIPEPSSLLLAAPGLMSILALRRRKKS